MPSLVEKPKTIAAQGNKPKTIEEFIGAASSGDAQASIARMKSPAGWLEPGQTPSFDEFSLVLSGTLRAEFKDKVLEAGPGQAIVARKGEWVRYSTPDGAEYVSVCVPAFTPASVHRDPA